MRFDTGDRVRVLEDYHWAKGAVGTIALPPEPVRTLVGSEEPWRGSHRTIKGVMGPILFCWVEFDAPQKDADGDGPYQAGEIDCAFLEPQQEES